MIRKIAFSLCFVGVLFGASAQHTITDWDFGAFQKVELLGNLNVVLIPSATAGVEIVLNGAQPEKLEWHLREGVLFIRLKPGSGSAVADVTVYYQNIRELTIAQAKVSLGGAVLASTVLDVQVEAGGVFQGAVELKDLNLKVQSNSAVELSGESKYYTLHASGSSKVNTRTLKCVDVNATANTTAEVYVWATERMQIVSSGASVFYRGEPEILRTTLKMMGTINSIGR